jgi:hypothetical protein
MVKASAAPEPLSSSPRNARKALVKSRLPARERGLSRVAPASAAQFRESRPSLPPPGMKQILLVLVVLAALMVGFFVQRKLTEPVRRTQPINSGQPVAGPNAANPQGPNNPNARNPNNAGKPRTGPGPLVFVEWKGMASKDSVVPLEEAWSLDFTQVDFDAPIVLRVGDVEITQADLRRMLCFEIGRSYHLARFTEAIALSQANRRGNSHELSNALYEELLAEAARRENVTLEEKKTSLAMQAQLPAQLGLDVHRRMTASLIYNAVGGEVDDLPIKLLDALRFVGPKDPEGNPIVDEQNRPQSYMTVLELREAWSRVHSAQQYEGRELDITKLSSLTQVLAALQVGMRNQELAQRCWTFLDTPMPDDVLLRIAVGDIDPEEGAVAPWLLGGEVVDVRVDEIWPSIEPFLAQSAREDALRKLVWFRYLAHSLGSLGVLPPAEESFARFVGKSEELAPTMFDLTFTAQSQGYPTIHHYRLVQRLFEGQRALLPAGWNEESIQRPFFEANRFFIERWNPQLLFAYFPALRYTEDANGGVTPRLDFDAALAEARAIKGKVALGQDFEQLAEAQAATIVASARRYVSEVYAEEYRQSLIGGQTMGTLRAVEERLGQTDYIELITGTSLVKHIAAYQDVGVVSEPMRVQGGYVVVRLERAELSTYEKDWADAKPLCEDYYQTSHFLRWSNTELAGAAKVYKD